MSFNVLHWKTKTIVDLTIPVESLYKYPREDWHPKKIQRDDGTTRFKIMDSWINGTVKDGILFVTGIKIQGEGSGTALNWVIEPALDDSRGVLVAIRVWESGDCIDKLTVINGHRNVERIEL